jgi:RimJ/RimL family protein N-acetyltransferase
MIIRKLTSSDKNKLDLLIKSIESTLDNKLWWLPISNKSFDNFFNDDWTYFLGLFEGDELVGASALFFNENEYGETIEHLKMVNKDIAEIGRCMVLKKYRGKNYMLELNQKLLKIASEHNIKKVIATAHPNNISSQCSLLSLGMSKVGSITKYPNFDRDIFLIEI